jgi:hypothetical protein
VFAGPARPDPQGLAPALLSIVKEFHTRLHKARPVARPWLLTIRAVSLLAGALCLSVGAARPAVAQITAQLTMHSEAGDYIGGGQDHSYDSTNAVFSAWAYDHTGDGLGDFVTLALHTPDWSHWWYLSFATNRLGTNLTPGSYGDAQRASFADPGHPGLDVTGDGRGCNTLTGSFTIEEAVFDYSSGSPQLIRFAASFEQHCEGMTPALTGRISFVDNSDHSVPTTTASLSGLAGDNGWYRGPVDVALTATDADGPADIASTLYSIDWTAPQTYAAPFRVAGDGAHAISFWSVDRAGNQETSRFQPIRIDGTAPPITVSATMQQLRTPKGNTALTTVTGNISDPLSGIDPSSATYSVADEYRLVQPSGHVTVQADGSYSFTLTLDASRNNNDKDGRTYQITVQARDLAGNNGAASVTLIVPRR